MSRTETETVEEENARLMKEYDNGMDVDEDGTDALSEKLGALGTNQDHQSDPAAQARMEGEQRRKAAAAAAAVALGVGAGDSVAAGNQPAGAPSLPPRSGRDGKNYKDNGDKKNIRASAVIDEKTQDLLEEAKEDDEERRLAIKARARNAEARKTKTIGILRLKIEKTRGEKKVASQMVMGRFNQMAKFGVDKAHLQILNNIAMHALPSERKAFDALLKNLITKNEKEKAIVKLEAEIQEAQIRAQAEITAAEDLATQAEITAAEESAEAKALMGTAGFTAFGNANADADLDALLG